MNLCIQSYAFISNRIFNYHGTLSMVAFLFKKLIVYMERQNSNCASLILSNNYFLFFSIFENHALFRFEKADWVAVGRTRIYKHTTILNMISAENLLARNKFFSYFKSIFINAFLFNNFKFLLTYRNKIWA